MTQRTHYDFAVIGLGTMGSFAAVELAKRGFSVIGLDQFTPPHDRGSHSGGTRIYRIAYPEGTGYVKLAQRAGELWDQAAEQFGTQLLHRIGLLYMGNPRQAFIQSIHASVSANQLRLETLSAAEVYRRYPAFEIPEDYVGVFDSQAGWIDVEASIRSAHSYATALGVECQFNQPVEGWDASDDHVRVHLRHQTVTASKLIITAGAWSGKVLNHLRLPLTVRRKVIAWFDPLVPELFAADRIPVFTFPEKWIYGFPNMPGFGVKLAEHLEGIDLPDADSPIAPPDASDLDSIRATASKYMPSLAGVSPGNSARLLHSITCLYTMTPDEDFIVDHHPQFSNVVFAAGFSGHGFKFAPLIAVALADLALDGKTSLPIDFLSLNRFATHLPRPGFADRGSESGRLSSHGTRSPLEKSGDD
ncbi:MAG: N-methyl-L-tryptophan oxidase [Terriglobales bacterium]|jgi:monomeric sarcosine oxidase